jgi:glycosyltransferase involved in cell wall biosynthesis
MRNLIVIPAYNEQESLPRTIAALQGLPADYELLVVNDGSTDRTSAVARELAATSRLKLHVIDLPLNGGIGVAVQTGYLFAAAAGYYRYVVQFDADGQHDAASIPALIAECEGQGLDICIGSRFQQVGDTAFRSTFLRRVGIRFLARLISLLGGIRVTDPTSGFRCAGPRAWREFAHRYPDDYPEPESLYWCIRNRLRVGEIPVVMYERNGGVSSIKTARAVYYMIKVTLAILIDLLRPKENFV